MLLDRLSPETMPPQAILLADSVVLMSMSKDHAGQSRFAFEERVPYGTVDVQSAAGPLKLAVCRITEDERLEHLDDCAQDFYAVLTRFPVIISDNVVDFANALDFLSQIRLLNFLLGFCCKAFDLSGDQGFARNCVSLARLCASPLRQLTPIAVVSDNWVVAQGLSSDAGASFWSLSPTRVRRLSVLDVDRSQSVAVLDRVGTADIIIALSDRVSVWQLALPTSVTPNFLRRSFGTDLLRSATLRVLVPHCAKTAAILLEQVLISPAEAVQHLDFRRPLAGALEAALPDGAGKIFLRGWLYDPHGLVASLELSGIAGSTPIEWTQLHRFFRPDLEKQVATSSSPRLGEKLGFIAYIDDPSVGIPSQPTLRIKHRSGAVTVLRPALQVPTAAEALNALLTCVQPQYVTRVLLEECIGPAAAQFHSRCLAERKPPEAIFIGSQPIEPDTSIVIPLYRNLSFLKYQVAAFANDESLRSAQIIYVLDSPEQRQELEHLLRGLNAVHEITFVLVIMGENAGYAASNNSGAVFATADRLLLLNSDVIPCKAGWIRVLHAALNESTVGAVGPKLLFEDESIQHAGLFFAKSDDDIWQNMHYFKGMPRHWPGAEVAREVPGVTGAAILVSTKDFHEVGGISEEYIVGDYEDSDFCLKLRKLGKSIRYVPAAEMFHFERRSIQLHKTYSDTLACSYNQRLHHLRWDTTISGMVSAATSERNELVEAL